MLRRSVTYSLLAAFAGAMVLLLMLDDPAAINGAGHVTVRLFPQLTAAGHIDRIEVQNVTEGTGVLLVRDHAGLWYAAQVPHAGQSLPASAINQAAVESIALAIRQLRARQSFEATSAKLARFGLRPGPAYTLQFAGRDASGRVFESVVFEVGDENPDRVARYVWPRDGQQVYLLSVDFLLEMLNTGADTAPASTGEPAVPAG